MVAITLVAGAAVFGFVNGQTSSSANAVGQNAASNINFLNERQVIVYAAVSTTPGNYTLWVYNSGSIATLNITAVNVFDTTTIGSSVPVSCSDKSFPLVPQYKVGELTATCGFKASHTYTFVATGKFGSTSQTVVRT